ncbi:MAG: hypothetical protein M3P45_16240 [Acidobacteriota bacterium]|nr:hypothetical protein [Acidobacteriota bacterium]
MPEDAQAVLFLDLNDLRRATFFTDLLAWAPKTQEDPQYRQFVRDTGFDFEKDLSSVAVAFGQQGQQQTFFAVAEGRFDEKKMRAYAAKSGELKNSGGPEIFSIPTAENTPRLFFTFLHRSRVAVSNRNDFVPLLQSAHGSKSPGNTEWQARFERVAGSPIFSVIRGQALKEYLDTPATSQDFARRATGLSSPQLSSLLAQLQWLTLAGKPENDTFRVVADGESLEDNHARQLADLLNGTVLLARAGLSTARTQQQIGAPARQSYLALLKTFEVSRIDRGETKSVRLMFDVTPSLLKSAQSPASASPRQSK